MDDQVALGPELSAQLRAIYANRPARVKQFYLTFVPGVGNPDFTREAAYDSLKLPDAGFQLLALFRYWNIIRYWFPYRDLITEDWDAVLADYVPRVALAKEDDAYKREMLTLIGRVHDSHANLWSSLQVRPPVGDCQLPVTVRFVEQQAVVSAILPDGRTPSQLRVGDVIEQIDGTPVSQLVKNWWPYYAGSNDPARLRDIARALTQGPAGETTLAVRRGEETLTIAARREPIVSLRKFITYTQDRPGEAFQLLSKDVAYLKLSSVKPAESKHYIERAAGTKGLVIDIRNYPSGFVVFSLGSLLVDQPTEFVRFTIGDLSNPGAFHFGAPLRLQPGTPHYAGKIVILVDEVSQSNAEYTAMAFRVAPGATVIGSTTAGADGNVSSIPLPGGLRTMISGIGVFYPDKRPTQRVGIVADIQAQPTLEGIRAGRDEVLEEGLRQILGPEFPAAELRRLVPTLSNAPNAVEGN